MTIDVESAKERMAAMLAEAAGIEPVIAGKAMGKSPKYFVVGDEPTVKDFIVGQPFSGPLNHLMPSLLETLKAEPDDLYLTYLVKCRFPKGRLTEKQVIELWLPIAQTEYALSGCASVVCVGAVAKLFAGHIATRAAFLAPRRNWKDRLEKAWRVLTT